jgi:hypothetical protein
MIYRRCRPRESGTDNARLWNIGPRLCAEDGGESRTRALEACDQNGPGTAGAGDDAEGERVGAVDRKDGVIRHVANNRSGRPVIAKLQRAGVDGGAAGIRLVALVKMVVPEIVV